jgi:hypothetical protein
MNDLAEIAESSSSSDGEMEIDRSEEMRSLYASSATPSHHPHPAPNPTLSQDGVGPGPSHTLPQPTATLASTGSYPSSVGGGYGATNAGGGASSGATAAGYGNIMVEGNVHMDGGDAYEVGGDSQDAARKRQRMSPSPLVSSTPYRCSLSSIASLPRSLTHPLCFPLPPPPPPSTTLTSSLCLDKVASVDMCRNYPYLLATWHLFRKCAYFSRPYGNPVRWLY